MFLTKVPLDAARRETMRALTNLQILHGFIERSFPGDKERRLWRIDQLRSGLCLLLLSREKPDLTELCSKLGYLTISEAGSSTETTDSRWESRAYGSFLTHLQNGQIWRFRLTANPVRASLSDQNRAGTRGKIRAHVSVEQQMDWLLSRSGALGVELDKNAVLLVDRRWHHFVKRSGQQVSIRTATYEGLLQIKDPDLLRDKMVNGVGRAKAYGCGLLTLARPD